MMPDLDRYLYDQLRSQAAGVDVPAGDFDAVMTRGRQRRHRRIGVSVLAAVAAAGTVTGVAVSDSNGGRHGQIAVGAPSSLPAATGEQLNWRVVPATTGLSDLSSLSSSGSVAYAVSTSPGVVPAGQYPAQRLYRSADGLSWTTATGPAGVSAAGVAVDGNRVYTVGTGPASAATGVSGAETTAVSWSDNGGRSWRNSALPIDLNAPAGAVTVNDEAVDVAAGPKGVVATVGINATADLSKLASGVSSQAMWTATVSGVEVLGSQVSSQCGLSAATAQIVGGSRSAGPLTVSQAAAAAAKLKAAQARQQTVAGKPASPGSGSASGNAKTPPLPGVTSKTPEGQIASTVPCVNASGQATRSVPADQAYKVTRSYSWSQLHIGGQVAAALQGVQLLFYSTDGSNFRPVSLPAGIAAADVTATPDGFALVAPDSNGPGTPVVLQSADGRNWTFAPFRLPTGATGASQIGYVDGHLVVLGPTQTGSAAYTLLPAGWRTTALPASYSGASFGPMGVALVGVSGSGDPGSWQVLFSRDGVSWSSASLVRLTGGAVDDANVVVGAVQVVVTVTRQPAQTSAPPSTQVQLVGTPAG